ncbi:Slam-dependent surface lipoprotein [Haemophilus parainfluenzae]|uniref:Slam-dependent surface lipoprotein n=1 Tax=Haemophilus parainfluenzae TaxID=729 RepID=UPI0018A585B7|nr:Slam-dependent surface lipoprotein [Haemophilus parainfluenzae]QOR14247.1 transferrin-binding protein-like solute binding protein [Haemophilus parainfluenzae]
MKNTILKFSLTALAALTLAACGSSGSGDAGSSSQAPTKDKQAAQATQATKNKNNVSDSASPSLNNKTGGVIVIDSDNKGNVTTKTVALTSANLYKINVDGKDIPIGFGPGISARDWTVASAQTINGMKLNGKLEVCCGSYSNVRFGAIESQDPSQDDILFYNGYPTTSMPSSGVASYVGDSIITADTDKLPDEDYVKGSSSFTADFGNKKLAGTISAANVDVVKIDANISGNGFSGTAKSDLLNSQGTAEGKFYGENAKELGGLAKANDNSWGAAFAAKK